MPGSSRDSDTTCRNKPHNDTLKPLRVKAKVSTRIMEQREPNKGSCKTLRTTRLVRFRRDTFV